MGDLRTSAGGIEAPDCSILVMPSYCDLRSAGKGYAEFRLPRRQILVFEKAPWRRSLAGGRLRGTAPTDFLDCAQSITCQSSM